jgi:hypothetical protein
LHSMLQMIFPGLSVNLANVQKNLEKWKTLPVE